MIVHNVRLGHACNSSSTHSIVPLSALGGRAHDDYEPGEFGWSHFMLASPEAKMEYLAATLCGYEPSEETVSRARSLTGAKLIASEHWGPYGYVDHQSQMALPVDGPHADLFLSDLAEYLRRDDVVILGGNDNGGRMTCAHLPVGTDYSAPARLRPDTAPDGSRYWTVMSGRRGDRIRFSFHGQPLSGKGDEDYGIPAVQADPLDVPYSNLPELVDMKVTGFCPFEKDCPWCYMASTSDGAHAHREDALARLRAFADAGVFEIALGGGEPTLWPHLPEFVQLAGSLGVNVNLTTKNIAWLKRGAFKGLTAVAISINNRRDLERFAATSLKNVQRDQGWDDRTEVTVQCVPAFCDDELLRDIIKLAHEQGLRVTFLGVKRTGRAAAETRSDDLRWLELLKPYRDHWWLVRGIAVDTLMAKASEPVFEELGIDPVWYETTEGKFSCYVDATTGALAASSYAPEEHATQWAPGEDFGVAYRTMQANTGLREAA